MPRLIVLAIAINIISSAAFSYGNLITSYKSAEDVFSDSVTLHETQFERIRNVVPNFSTKKFETARNFLAHYNSLKPIAVLIDDTKESHDDAKNFMDRVFQVTPNAKYIPFFLQKFNISGVSPYMKIEGNNTFKTLLDTTPEHGMLRLDPTESNGTAVFFAVLNAANALPQNSAILIFINRDVADEDLASHTSLLRKKNIKVYVIWGKLYPTKYGQGHLLKELCEYSGGLFLINTGKDLSDHYYRQFLADKTHWNVSIILSKNNLVAASELTLPIDSKITGIHVRIAPFVLSGSISTPKGYVIDVLRKEEISGYSNGSFGVVETGFHIIHLNLTTAPSRGVGVWRLKLDNTLAPYNVTVFAYTQLTAQAYLVGKSTGHHNSKGSDGNVVKLGISASITSINSISFVDKDGQPITDNVKYTFDKDSLKESNISYQNTEVDVEFFNGKEQPTYALIQGKDSEGNEFSRLSYVDSYNSGNIFPQPSLTIEVGAGSELITEGGKFPVITFEVTNHRSAVLDVRFTCKDNKSILRFLQPYRILIGPEETVTVRLTLITRFGSYEDEITFNAWIGSESFQKIVIVDVRSQPLYDNENPELDYSFSSDCSKVVFSKCTEGTWTVKVVAKDTGSGLLQVTSYPKGLYFPYGFTTGSRQEVTGYYSDSCCNPDLQITAIDRSNNRNVINVNAYRAFWGPAQIAALVLGILIFIFLIVLIVYIVRKCIKKRENYNLPTYRGGRI